MCNVSAPSFLYSLFIYLFFLDAHKQMLVPRYGVWPGITRKMTVTLCLTAWALWAEGSTQHFEAAGLILQFSLLLISAMSVT
jgi:hypothetical protein